MTRSRDSGFDLLEYIEDHLLTQESLIVAGQEAMITNLTKTIHSDHLLTLSIDIRPLKQITR